MQRNNELREAVRALRTAMEKTQTEFGLLLGKGIATIQRYETLVPPRGPILAKLSQIAERHGRADLAQVFARALAEEMGTAESALTTEEQALSASIIELWRSSESAGWARVQSTLARTMRALAKISKADPVKFNQLETLVVFLGKCGPAAQKMSRAVAARAKERGISKEEAYSRLLLESPKLYAELRLESSRGATKTQFAKSESSPFIKKGRKSE